MSTHAPPPATSASGEESGRPAPSPAVITAVIALSGVVVSLMQTLVVPLIPVLPELLDAEPADASWAVTATLLAAAVVTPVAGRLGDMFGKRRVIIASLVVMVTGSLLCALFDSLVPVVLGRALQGLAAGLVPLGISVLRDELPAERVGSAVGVVSASLGVGGAIGLPLSAAVAEYANWHTLFWMATLLGAVCLLLIVRIVPESPTRNPGRFDAVGALGLSTGLVCLLLPITKGGSWGWTSPTTLLLFAAAVVILLAWGAYEVRLERPLVNLRVTARRSVLFTNLASVMVGFSMYGMSLAFPQLLQSPEATGYGLGESVIVTGLVLAPSGLVMMLFSPLSARISARSGPRTALLTGLGVICFGYVLSTVLMAQVWQVVLASLVIGAGVGIAFAAMPALIMSAVPVSETGAANGLNSLMRAIGTSLSSAVMSAVLANMTMRVGPAQLPTEGAFRMTFVIAAVAAVAGMALTALIPRRKDGAATG